MTVSGFIPLLLLTVKCVSACTTRSQEAAEYPTCVEADDILSLQTDALQALYSDVNFLVMPDFRPPLQLKLKFPEERSDKGIKGNECIPSLEVPTHRRHTPNEHTRQKDASTCPWRQISTVDPSRLPVSIDEVECTCDRCVHEVVCPYTKEVCYQLTGRCEPVFSSIPVIKRECNTTSGLYQYRAGLQQVSVGCTCIRNNIAEE